MCSLAHSLANCTHSYTAEKASTSCQPFRRVSNRYYQPQLPICIRIITHTHTHDLYYCHCCFEVHILLLDSWIFNRTKFNRQTNRVAVYRVSKLVKLIDKYFMFVDDKRERKTRRKWAYSCRQIGHSTYNTYKKQTISLSNANRKPNRK